MCGVALGQDGTPLGYVQLAIYPMNDKDGLHSTRPGLTLALTYPRPGETPNPSPNPNLPQAGETPNPNPNLLDITLTLTCST